MAAKVVNSVKAVTTAGTRVQITDDNDTKCSSVYFEALGTNTGYIYVGLSDVSSTQYIAKLAVSSTVGQGFALDIGSLGGQFRLGGQGIQLSNFWIDSSVNGESVLFTYVQPNA